jgi:hypothetical protein
MIPIPSEWHKLGHIRLAVSVDGLQPDHDARRAPATYDRILENISGRRVDISWVITRPQMERPDYLSEYLAFWTARPAARSRLDFIGSAHADCSVRFERRI